MVKRTILLDSGPIGLITNPNQIGENLSCTQWLKDLAAQDQRIVVPEIVDYEVRRELLRANKTSGIRNLEALLKHCEYLPLNTAAMRLAANLWARARQQGQPTASDKTIDIDMILVAQAMIFDSTNAIIATTNVGHLVRFINADPWSNIID